MATTHHPSARVEPRDVLFGHGDSEPVMGFLRYLCGHGRGPFWRFPRLDGWCLAVRAGPVRHGDRLHPLPVFNDGRRVDRCGTGRHDIRRDLRCHWPQHIRRQAIVGNGCCRRSRLIRAVFNGANRRPIDLSIWLAERPDHAVYRRLTDPAAGLRPAGARLQGRRRTRAGTNDSAGPAGSRPLPQFSITHGGLFCLWLSSGVHWRSHAQLPA